MVATKLYKNHVIEVGATTIDSISNVDFAANNERFKEILSGEIDPKFIATLNHNPTIGFTSMNIKAAIDEIPLIGNKIEASNKFVTFFKRYAAGGTIMAGGSHVKMEVNSGIVVLRSLTATQGSAAEITCECQPVFDGTNDPIIMTDAQVLSGTIADTEIWTLGPAVINGVTIETTEISFDFGISLFVEGSDGDAFPSFVSLNNRVPVITVKTMDLSRVAALDIKGEGITTVSLFFRKMAAGGLRVPDASLVHIQLTLNDGQVNPDSATVSTNDKGEATIIMEAINDGVNDIL